MSIKVVIERIAEVGAGFAIGVVAAVALIWLFSSSAPVYPPTWLDHHQQAEAP